MRTGSTNLRKDRVSSGAEGEKRIKALLAEVSDQRSSSDVLSEFGVSNGGVVVDLRCRKSQQESLEKREIKYIRSAPWSRKPSRILPILEDPEKRAE